MKVNFEGKHYEIDEAAEDVLRKFGCDKETIEFFEFDEFADKAKDEDLTVLNAYKEKLAMMTNGKKLNIFISGLRAEKLEKTGTEKEAETEASNLCNGNSKIKSVFSEGNRVKSLERTYKRILQEERNESVQKLKFEPDNLMIPFYSKALDCTLYVNKKSFFNYKNDDIEHPVIIEHNHPDYLTLTFLIPDDYSDGCDVIPHHMNIVINRQKTGGEEIYMPIGEINVIPKNMQRSEKVFIDIIEIAIDGTTRLNISDKIIFIRLSSDYGVYRVNDRWYVEVKNKSSLSKEEQKELILYGIVELQPVYTPNYDSFVKFGYSNTYNPNDVVHKF